MRLDFLAYHFRPQDGVAMNDAVDAIHKVLVELWMKEYPNPASTQSLTNPTLAFICMQSVNADGSYMKAHELAGLLAHLTRAIRLSIGVPGPSPARIPHLRHLAGTRVDNVRGLLRWVDDNNLVDLPPDNGGLPTEIDYDALTDDLRCNISGYSPVDLVWRKSPESIMHFSGQLLKHPALGLTLHMTGELASNPTRAWLQVLEQHELLTLAYVQLTCGGPARTSEPIQLLMRNTPTRLRNLYMFGRRVCLVVRSTPSSSLRRHNEVLVVSLDGFISDMLMRNLVFCRRPAEFLASKLFPSIAPQPARLYRDLCFTGFGRSFTSDDLSNAMGAESFPIVGFDLHLALFRTGFQAFSKQLVLQYNDRGDAADVDDVASIDALHAGYAPRVGRQLQGLARNAFDGTPVALIHRDIRDSDRWQSILQLQPGGRCSPYCQAVAADGPAPALDLQGPTHLTGHQHAQLLPNQMTNVTALVQALLQQTDNLRVEIGSIRAQIVPGVPARAPSPVLGSPPTASSAAPPPSTAVHSQDTDMVHEEDAVAEILLDLDGGMSNSSDMQISLDSGDNPRALSFIPTDLRTRPNAGTSMAPASLAGPPSASWRVFPREDGMEFMNTRPYRDPYHVPPSDAIWVARRISRAPNAQWKSDEQYCAIYAMAALERDLCVVRSSTSWAVEHERFENGESHVSGAKKIILVSVDAARLYQWRTTLFRLQNAGSVFLRIMPDIRWVNAPVVLMTSIMPPHAIPFFTQEYRLVAPLVIRGFTDRPEIQYNIVASMGHIDPDDSVDRFFVFVFSRPMGRELARLTDLPFWPGASDDGEQPSTSKLDDLQDNFIEGTPPGLIAYGELGAVIQSRHAHIAILVHPPPNLILAMHLLGQLSRDGRPATAYIMPAPTQPIVAASPAIAMLQGVQAMLDIQYVMPLWHHRRGRCVRRVVLEASDCISLCCYEIADAQLCCFCREFALTLDRDELKSLGAGAYNSREPPPLRPLRIRESMPQLSKDELKERLDQQFGGI
ncbi:hypothetical protein K525DRAFT_244978, partial [Schizophyllum commune Loenen D]